jgi:hypothetical protein
VRYVARNFIGSATKGLAHDANGEVVPKAYEAYLGAIRSGAQDDFEALVTDGYFGWPIQDERRRFVNPQSGYALDLLASSRCEQRLLSPVPKTQAKW